jgi:hypothetical protein
MSYLENSSLSIARTLVPRPAWECTCARPCLAMECGAAAWGRLGRQSLPVVRSEAEPGDEGDEVGPEAHPF